MEIKALETRYKGHTFRSRLEARWAIYFDAFGIQWEYEREGFDLPSGRYLPDFWLPQVKMWAEVKPEMFSDFEYQKCLELSRVTQHEVLLLDGPPAERNYWATPAANDYQTDYIINGDYLEEHRFFGSTGGSANFPYHDSGKDFNYNDRTVCDAVRVAMGARFDNGEYRAS